MFDKRQLVQLAHSRKQRHLLSFPFSPNEQLQSIVIGFLKLKLASKMAEARRKQRAVIEFLVAEGETPLRIQNRLENVYKDDTIDYSTVKRWVQRFKNSTEDHEECPADVSVEDLHPEKHNRLHVKQQEESEMPYIKKEAEPETPYIKEEEQGDEILKFPVTVSVKSEKDEGPSEESGAARQDDLLALLSDSDECPTGVTLEDLHPEKHDPFHIKQEQESEMSYIKQDAEPESPYIKEEKQFHQQFPETVCVKNEEDDNPSEEKGATEHLSNSLFQHLTTKGEVQSLPDDPLAPYEDSDDITSRFSDFNTDKSSLKSDAKECAGGKLFPCTLCDRTYSWKTDLQRHKRTHTEEQPFVCTICGKSFTEKRNLSRHAKTHAEKRKPFACSFCEKKFCSNYEVTKHVRIHTGEKPFSCSVCHKRFRLRATLNRHARTHTGEKPFACSFCGKRFAENGNLIKHKKTHTGEKPFVCTRCGKRFSMKGNLKKHTRTQPGCNILPEGSFNITH
ncbi:zinc finger protein 771-like isoform X2 [Corythoichthys intestinalis]|uniref:zinc finger protein 771-like isoform X2 n=1 Tax=Corythoichthys intestinalis TaxID=161448 RepID=UPI0025A5D0D6|nr:zinc finger protein 771-like isoform X2 [Corythoichthys intestinalis]